MKGVTPRQPPRSERQTAPQSVLDQSLACVFRARGREPTRAGEQGRHQALVDDHRAGREPAQHPHASLGPGIAPSAWRICPSSVPKGALRAAGRPMTTTAARAGAASRAARYASRNRRRARLRCTASRNWRLTAKPTRVDSVDSRQSTMSAGRSIRLPRWKSAWNSALVVSRWRRERPPLRRSAVCDLSRDGASTPFARPSCSCARETRGSWPGGADWVETFASSSSSPLGSLNRHSVGMPPQAVNQRTPLRRCEMPC